MHDARDVDGGAVAEDLRRRVVALCEDFAAGELGDFAYLPGGYSNRNYRFAHRGEHYVLRIPERDRPFVDRALEAAFYRAPGAAAIPSVVALDVGTGAMISRFEPGPLLCDAPPPEDALVPYVRDLHRALPPCARRYDPIALSVASLSAGDPPPEVRALAEGLRWTPRETTTCHNDLNPWNVVRRDDGRWVTLDWEWLGANDPVFDLVTLHQGLGLDDAALPALAGELLGAAPGRDRVRDCLTAFWLREYAWAHAERAAGNERVEIREQLRTSADRLRALTRTAGAARPTAPGRAPSPPGRPGRRGRGRAR